MICCTEAYQANVNEGKGISSRQPMTGIRLSFMRPTDETWEVDLVLDRQMSNHHKNSPMNLRWTSPEGRYSIYNSIQWYSVRMMWSSICSLLHTVYTFAMPMQSYKHHMETGKTTELWVKPPYWRGKPAFFGEIFCSLLMLKFLTRAKKKDLRRVDSPSFQENCKSPSWYHWNPWSVNVILNIVFKVLPTRLDLFLGWSNCLCWNFASLPDSDWEYRSP